MRVAEFYTVAKKVKNTVRKAASIFADWGRSVI